MQIAQLGRIAALSTAITLLAGCSSSQVVSKDSPDAALQQFLIAMGTGDKQSLMAVTVPMEGIELLLDSQELTAGQKKDVQKHVSELTFTKLKVGETAKLPDGRVVKMDDTMVNADRQQLIGSEKQAPFVLERSEGKWRVNPSWVIAARRAAKNR